ncbi:MAG TPA: aminotransferase class III-fold pyridoxal phosphate-dependent enzyme [Polyangiaceae bacterium]|nr:aminotransferase class III-fold pyridoxal phosphate-dependent enzyme [Polyangiaceae bacterium]
MEAATREQDVGDPPEAPRRGRYAASAAISRRAHELIPGGHHLSGRPLLAHGASPLYFVRGKGSRIWDVDGNEYVDYVMAYGPFLLGYANDVVDAAAEAQAASGNLLSLNHPVHVAFAERLLRWFPGADQVVPLKTGSDATTAALRIARRYTGRRRVVRCGYHGWHDWCLPEESFVPPGLSEQVGGFDANDPASLHEVLSRWSGQVAAVILAPEMMSAPSGASLAELVRITHEFGAVFVLDEVKTAFRTPPGSVQERFGVVPDLTTVSKALGNGHPIAAVLGRRQVMRAAAGLHLSATYHGEVTAMVAAIATLDLIERTNAAAHAHAMGERLISGLNESARRHGVPAVAYGEPLPSMPFLKFRTGSAAQDELIREAFYGRVLDDGILLHPRHLWFPSLAHSAADVERTIAVCDAAFAHVASRPEFARGLGG